MAEFLFTCVNDVRMPFFSFGEAMHGALPVKKNIVVYPD